MEEKRKQRVHEALSRFFSELPAFLLSSTKHESDFLEIRVQFSPIPENAPVTRKKKAPPSKIRRNRKRLEVFLEKTRNKANDNVAVDTNGDPGKKSFGTPASAHGVFLQPQEETVECSYNIDENTYVHDNNSGAGPGAESDGGEETTSGGNGDDSENKMEDEEQEVNPDEQAKIWEKWEKQFLEDMKKMNERLDRVGERNEKTQEILSRLEGQNEEKQSKTGASEDGIEKAEKTFESWEEEVEKSTSDGVAPEQKETIRGKTYTQALLSTPYRDPYCEWNKVNRRKKRGKNKIQKDESCKTS